MNLEIAFRKHQNEKNNEENNYCICGALRDLLPFVQFKKREKHPQRSANFRACNFSKINTPPWVFFMFYKLYKWYQIAQRTTYFYSIIYSLEFMGLFSCGLIHNLTIFALVN